MSMTKTACCVVVRLQDPGRHGTRCGHDARNAPEVEHEMKASRVGNRVSTAVKGLDIVSGHSKIHTSGGLLIEFVGEALS